MIKMSNVSISAGINFPTRIKLKEETDSWLIEKLKNHNDDSELLDEIRSLKERVEKLENIIKNLTKAFK